MEFIGKLYPQRHTENSEAQWSTKRDEKSIRNLRYFSSANGAYLQSVGLDNLKNIIVHVRLNVPVC